jgi:hypothetical protein
MHPPIVDSAHVVGVSLVGGCFVCWLGDDLGQEDPPSRGAKLFLGLWSIGRNGVTVRLACTLPFHVR